MGIFNFFNRPNEQAMMSRMTKESISIYGHGVFYLPRSTINKNNVLNEFETYSFNDALQIEAYIKNVDSFEGDGQFLSKFGVEIRDQITLTISIDRFDEVIGGPINIVKPREGDVIYVPMTDAIYQIRFVDDTKAFYKLGSVYSYDLTIELFEYNNEVFNTGYDFIDSKYNSFSTDAISNYTKNENNIVLEDEYGQELIDELYKISNIDPVASNDDIQIESDKVLDFDEKNPFGRNP